MRPISNIVDATNYVMLALGSPLHFFDISLLAEERIVVRRAGKGEKIVTLDGHERELAPSDLVIADARRPVAVAGIMGGEDSEVRDDDRPPARGGELRASHRAAGPRRLRLRARRRRASRRASTPTRRTSRRLCERASRFAHRRAADRSRRRPGDAAGAAGRAPAARACRPPERDEVPGGGAARDARAARLRRRRRRRDRPHLARSTSAVLSTSSRSRFRIEEVPSTLPARDAASVQLSREQRFRRLVEDVLAGAGRGVHVEPFVPPAPGPACARGAVHGQHGRAAHGPSPRPARSAERNRNAGVEQIALFEIARVTAHRGEQLPEERWHVAAVTEGGFFRAKGAAELVHRALGVALEVVERGPAAQHGQRSASSPSFPAGGASSSSTWTRSSLPRPTRSPTRT